MTTLYWFSGTGNSLAMAREIAGTLDDVRFVPIASLGPGPVTVDGDFGLVCPVYFEGLPLIVREFLERIDASRCPYAFLVVTAGGFSGWAAEEGRNLLRRAGKELDAAFAVKMPDNYIAGLDVPKAAARDRLHAQASLHAARMARDVAARTRRRGTSWGIPFGWLAYATLGREFAHSCRGRDTRFVVTDVCTSCGACARVCPVRNIDLVDGHPCWHHRCEQCLACIHWCPVAAIQIRGRPTAKRGRYHHPDVSLEDIASQQGPATPGPLGSL